MRTDPFETALLVAALHQYAIDREARALRHGERTRVDGAARGVEGEFGFFGFIDRQGHAARHVGCVGSRLQDRAPARMVDDRHEFVCLGTPSEANIRADDLDPAAVLTGLDVRAHLRSPEEFRCQYTTTPVTNAAAPSSCWSARRRLRAARIAAAHGCSG